MGSLNDVVVSWQAKPACADQPCWSGLAVIPRKTATTECGILEVRVLWEHVQVGSIPAAPTIFALGEVAIWRVGRLPACAGFRPRKSCAISSEDEQKFPKLWTQVRVLYGTPGGKTRGVVSRDHPALSDHGDGEELVSSKLS